jgi:eukaryotic-like serine/threonine-protein kinase
MRKRPLHPMQLRAGDRVRDLRIVYRLGVGGFSFVFLVEREGQRAVLKMATRPLSEEDQDQVDAWMRREVVSLECLEHPNVLPVREWGRWPDAETGYAYFVMPYVPASTFHEWRWRERASLYRTVGVLCEVLKPLEVLHARGVCHRDLKADNVLVGDGDDKAFLIDFGAVHLPWARPLTEGLAPGTIYCQPPEAIAFLTSAAARQGARLEARPAADLYTFGVLLYETLTGCRPFNTGWRLEELLVAIASAPAVEPRRLAPDAPASLCALASRLLAKEPGQRPSSARAIREELERLRAEEGHTEAWRAPAKSPSECARVRERFPGMDVLEQRRARSSRPALPPPTGRARGVGLVLALVLLGLGWMLASALPAHSEKGTQSVSSTPSTEASPVPTPSLSGPSRPCALLTSLLGATAAQLVGCATVPARPDPIGYLASCSAEARATPVKLGFASDENPSFLYPGSPATSAGDEPIEEGGPLNLKPGPVTAYMSANVKGQEVEFIISGEAVTLPHRVYMRFDRLLLPDGSSLPICGVAVDDLSQYGIATFAKVPVRGVMVDANKVDKSPGSVVLDGPRFETVLQYPEGHPMPRVRLAPPDYR